MCDAGPILKAEQTGTEKELRKVIALHLRLSKIRDCENKDGNGGNIKCNQSRNYEMSRPWVRSIS